MNGWPILGLGMVLGMRHAMDPDHVVAVAAMTARLPQHAARRVWSAAWLGAVWGLGHTLTLGAAGAVIILLNLTLPPRLGLSFEFLVALALVTVGALNIGRVTAAESSRPAPRIPALRAFGVGLAHGLAGSAAVALLVLATVRDTRLACGYLLVFGFGTILGMVLVSTGFSAPLSLATRRWPRLESRVRIATGALSLAFGTWLIFQIAFVDGLFLAHPHWTPH
jgi:high-affinity nickel-transport protein